MGFQNAWNFQYLLRHGHFSGRVAKSCGSRVIVR
jgi:hypothetical protein